MARQRTATRGVARDGAAAGGPGSAAAPFCRGRRSAALHAASNAFRYACMDNNGAQGILLKNSEDTSTAPVRL